MASIETEGLKGNFHQEQQQLSEIARSGQLSEFLDTYLLPGYQEKFGDPSDPSFQNISQGIDQIITTLLSTETFGIDSINLTGSLARMIAQDKLPDHFWDIADYLRDQYLLAIKQGDSDAADALSSFTHGPSDIDIKINCKPDTSIVSITKSFTEKLAGARNSTFKELIGQDQNGELNNYESIVDISDLISLHIVAGPSPTNPNRFVGRIGLESKITGDEVFHIDLGHHALTAEQALVDKRVGLTCRKQDKCFASLDVVDKHVHYQMTQSTVNIFHEQDEILTTSDTPSTVLETCLRSLRINLLHGNGISNQLDHFSPLFTSASLFALRDRIFSFVLNGDEIDNYVIPLLHKELLLCLTIDPYTTVQFLRDTGLSMLIPGLSHVTRYMWDEFLTSNAFAVDTLQGRLIPKPERSYDWLHRQRQLYRERSGNIKDPYDGVTRLNNVISKFPQTGTNKENIAWTELRRLWNRSPGPSIHKIDIGELQKMEGIQIINIDGAIMVVPDNYNDLDLRKLAAKIFARLHPYIQSTLTEHVDKIIHTEKVIFSRRKKFPTEETEIDTKSMALVLSILERFPAGLTARELGNLYEESIVDFEKNSDFGRTLWWAKLTGLIHKDKLLRTDRHGQTVEVETYSFHRVHPEKIIIQPTKEDLFLQFGIALKKSLLKPEPDNMLKTELDNHKLAKRYRRRAELLFSKLGVRSYQAVLSLTETDIQLMSVLSGISERYIRQTISIFQSLWLDYISPSKLYNIR